MLVSLVQLLAVVGVLELRALSGTLAALSPASFGSGMLVLSVWILGVRLRAAYANQPTATA